MSRHAQRSGEPALRASSAPRLTNPSAVTQAPESDAVASLASEDSPALSRRALRLQRAAEEQSRAEAVQVSKAEAVAQEQRVAHARAAAILNEKREAQARAEAEAKRRADEMRLAEQARLAEQRRLADEKRIADEKAAAEARRLIEARAAEQKQRLADEKARIAAEQKAQREAEENARLEREAKRAEERRRADELHRRAEALIAKEAEARRLAEAVTVVVEPSSAASVPNVPAPIVVPPATVDAEPALEKAVATVKSAPILADHAPHPIDVAVTLTAAPLTPICLPANEPAPLSLEPSAEHLPPLLSSRPAVEHFAQQPGQETARKRVRRGSTPAVARDARRVRTSRRRPRLAVMAVAAGFILPAGLPAYAFDPVIVASNEITPESTAQVAMLNQQYLGAQNGDATDTAQALTIEREGVSSTAKVAAGAASIAVCRLKNATVPGEVAIPVPDGAYYLSSGLGYRYISSIRWSDYHTGQDFASAYGVSILSATAGTVVEVGNTLGATYVKIHSELSTGEKVDFYYVHMSPDQVFVKAGDVVHAGEEIALVGSTGVSTGPHLHLEIHDASKGDTQVAERATLLDPWPWLEAHDAQSPGTC